MSIDKNRFDTGPDEEPTAGTANAPVWLIILIALLVWWGMTFLDARGGGFNARVYEPYYSFKQVDDLQPRSAEGEYFVKGKRIYETYCGICHQPTGQGLPGQYPPLTGSNWVLTEGSGRLVRLVLDGMQGAITVTTPTGQHVLPPGVAMPPWKELLKDDDISAVLTYVRGNKGWGNNASAVTPDQVKAIRAKVADRSTSWSPEELLQVPDKD